MTFQAISSVPSMKRETKGGLANPLRPLLITVFTAKIAIASLLLATVSLAPPVSADSRYLASLN